MVDRSTRCISQVFGFLQDVEQCDNCDTSSSSDFGETSTTDSNQLLKKSISDTKLFNSTIQNKPQVVRKCMCHLTRQMVLDGDKDAVHPGESSTEENGMITSMSAGTKDESVNGEHFRNRDTVVENENGDICLLCEDGTATVEIVDSKQDVSKKSNEEIGNASLEVCCKSGSENLDNSINGTELTESEDDVLIRPKSGEKKNERSNTAVVSEMFRFLNTNSVALEDDKIQSGSHIQDLNTSVETKRGEMVQDSKLNRGSELNNQNKESELNSQNKDSKLNIEDKESKLTVQECEKGEVNLPSSGSTSNPSSENVKGNQSSVSKSTFYVDLEGIEETVQITKAENLSCTEVEGKQQNGMESERTLKSDSNKETVQTSGVANRGCVTSKVVKEHNDGSSREAVCGSVVSDGLTTVDKCPDKVCGGQVSCGSGEVVIRRRQSSRKSEADDHSDDSSDEDTGIYAESYRNSTWIRVDDDVDISSGKSATLPARKTTEPDVIMRASSASMSDDVFTEGRGSPMVVRTHKRSDSSTTTLSETEFKRQYTSRRKCLIQRDDSQQEYHRFSAKFYDQERVVVVQKEDAEVDQDFGLHIIDYQPAYITSVDLGSPAARAGLQEGQILISVNGVNVLEATHDEVVRLMQQNPSVIKLEVAYSDFQPVRDLQAPVMSGYMYKLGNSSLMKTWKKRYFVLRQDNCLYYYKTEQEQIPLGAVPLAGYSISRFIDTNKDYCFKADKYGARSYFFMTDSRDDMTKWVGKLTEAASKSKKRKDSWLDVSSHNVGLPALEIRRPESTGYLSKMGRQRKVWKKRYCVLKDACIYYYKLMSSHSAQGVAHLHGYEVDKTGYPGKRYSFVLKPPEPGMRTFYFCAENETDKTRWVEAMTRSIQRWVKVDDTVK